MKDMQSMQSLPAEWRWKKKSNRAFWRGRDSRGERLDLVRLARKHKDLLDAELTEYFFFTDQEKDLGKADYLDFFQFFKVGPSVSA